MVTGASPVICVPVMSMLGLGDDAAVVVEGYIVQPVALESQRAGGD